ncbi:MAG: XdhC family protein [Bacteroidota bacterium]
MNTIYSKIEELRNDGKGSALCIVISTSGSTPRKTGAKMIVLEDKTIFGTIGGGSIEKDVIDHAADIIKEGKPVIKSYQLEEDLKMKCGGSMEVYIEPLNVFKKLYIFGAGHIGKAVVKYAKELEFNITVFDTRKGIFDQNDFNGCKCVCNDYFKAIDETVFDENTFIVIVTPKHEYDEGILRRVAVKPHAYVGMIGSKRKVEVVKKNLLDEKILSLKEIEKIDMPMGIKFAAETPQEIAISIVAKLIDVRNSSLKA